MICISYTAIERETVIRCDDEGKLWEIYTLMPTVITKLKKAGIEPIQIDEDGAHHFRDVPFGQVSFRQESKGREMSEEQRQAAAERLRKAREKKGE